MANAQPALDAPPSPPSGELQATGTLDIKDSRTSKNYSVQIIQGGVEGDTATRAMDLRQIKTAPDEFGLMTYDPAFMNTASCKSAITFIDGDRGILRYRGYPIEQLAEESTYLETAYLILNGELPSPAALQEWERQITMHTTAIGTAISFSPSGEDGRSLGRAAAAVEMLCAILVSGYAAPARHSCAFSL